MLSELPLSHRATARLELADSRRSGANTSLRCRSFESTLLIEPIVYFLLGLEPQFPREACQCGANERCYNAIIVPGSRALSGNIAVKVEPLVPKRLT